MILLHPDTRRLLGELPYRDYHAHGTAREARVPILAIDATGLPRGVKALMLTADLQGSAGEETAPILPLEALVEVLRPYAESGTIPALARTVAILAGDFWARPDSSRLGGEGDVGAAIRRVRDAFLETFVVFGDHDRVGDRPSDLVAFGAESGIQLASDRVVESHGIRIAGVDGIVGDPARGPFRRPITAFVAAVDRAIQQRPDIVLLHQGPARGTARRPVVPEVVSACRRRGGGFIVFGHDYEVYSTPKPPVASECCILEVREGLQYVNASRRIIVAVNTDTSRT